jgi:phosphomannomutase
MAIIRSISGLRAQFGSGLTPQLISNYAYSYHKVMPEGKIIIGKDGRLGSNWIEKCLIGTLESLGRDLVILGLVPTPTVQYFAEKTNAIGGIVITASHNPQDWCGLKFLDENGVFLNQNKNEELWKILDTGDYQFPDLIISKNQHLESGLDTHIDSVLSLDLIKSNDTINKIKSKNLKVVVDAVNCSGSVIIPKLLRKLGFEVIELFCEGNGVFIHTPEPIPENLEKLCEEVYNQGADFGVAIDPDADRLVIIDENGEPIGEEKTVVFAIKAVFDFYKGKKDLIATVNLSSSRMAEDIALEYGGKLERSPVGEINVVEKMKSNSSIIGGEGSGGVIFPDSHYGRDSLIGIGLLSYLLSNSTKSMSELSEELPSYEIVKTKFTFDKDFGELVDKVKSEFNEGKFNFEDGVRVDFSKSWVQVRRSNTEPIIRIIAEAATKNECNNLISRISKLL